MKSLDLINERIEDLESRLESANYLANDNPSYFGKQLISDLNKHLSSCKTIKQDLEDYFIIREIEEKVREGKMVIRNGKKYYASEFILAEQGTIRHLTIWYNDYKKVLDFEDYKKTWEFED